MNQAKNYLRSVDQAYPKLQFILPVAGLYMFFNAWLLPNGLFYTTLLAPVFFVNTIRRGLFRPYLVFLLISAAYLVLQWQPGISGTDYLRSWLLTLLNMAFLCNAWLVFRSWTDEETTELFGKLCYLNAFMVIIALIAWYIPLLKPVFWYLVPITTGSGIIPRLKMLTSEASIYSLMLSPLVLFFFYSELLSRKRISLAFILLLLLPLAFSFSLGVLSSLFIAVLISIFRFRSIFFRNRRLVSMLLWGVVLFAATLLFLYLFYPDNLLFVRIRNIFTGDDTSARGRTYEAFEIARRVLNNSGQWWFGIGPGQFKLSGKYILLSYYQYSGNVTDIRIPNACADTLIVYGISGLFLRLGAQVVLFWYTRVYRNVFRFSLFCFLFLYQFTGSYFNNLLEWTLWVMVFSGGFLFFDQQRLKQQTDLA